MTLTEVQAARVKTIVAVREYEAARATWQAAVKAAKKIAKCTACGTCDPVCTPGHWECDCGVKHPDCNNIAIPRDTCPLATATRGHHTFAYVPPLASWTYCVRDLTKT